MCLSPGRVKGMVDECLREDTIIPCHKTLGHDEAICRGLFDLHSRDIAPLRLALFLSVVEDVRQK
jgi:hypothetical protein